MPALSRASGLAAVALVALVGVGAFLYLNSGPGIGARPTPTPGVTPAPTAAAGIPGWTSYTSEVYGFTMAYPSDWSLNDAANHKWQPGEPAVPDAWPWADIFASSDEEIGMFVWQVPAPAGSDLDSWEGLQAALSAVCEAPSFGACEFDPPTPMCLGQQECQPALVVSLGIEESSPNGVFGDPATNTITVFKIARPDDFPGAAKYGGTVALLKAILTQVEVRAPQPGETPH